MATLQKGDDTFESGCDLLDVTSLHRPDTDWRHLDQHGHDHRWHVNGQPAARYDPAVRYELPTLVSVHDEWAYDEDGERYELTHLECRHCGERIMPGYRADDCTQQIRGLSWYRVNGELVSPEEFQRRFSEARG